MCIDGWWQSGGIQDQVETRRHDLSDAQAFLGITSVPRAVTDYSTNSLMLRNEDKDSYFEIVDDDKTINVVCEEKINVTAKDDISVKTDKNLNVTAALNIFVTAGATTNITTAGVTNITSGAEVNVKASTINLN
jgi:hypothetical protein